MAKKQPEPKDFRAQIVEALGIVATGKSMKAACEEVGIVRQTALDWINRDPDLQKMREAAIEAGTDVMAEECLEIADTPHIGEEVTIKPNGDREVREVDMLGHRRLRIDTRLRLMGKWNQAKYGDSQELRHKVDPTVAAAILAARARSGK